MSYEPIFQKPESSSIGGSIYVLDDEDLLLAINVALATGRPLLLRGPPGCGKSTLAKHVAHGLGKKLYEKVITSRTQARDLQWSFDAVARLGETQLAAASQQPVPDKEAFVEPGVLWWAYSPETALQRGAASLPAEKQAKDPGHSGPTVPAPRKPVGAVVLIDEIDKADPDVPNDLLVAIDQQWFVVAETGFMVKRTDAAPPFVVFTTNEERELAPAFLRRCIVYEIHQRDTEALVAVAQAHHGPREDGLYTRLAEQTEELRKEHMKRGEDRPGTAEYLDAVRATLALVAQEGTLASIQRIVLERPRRAP